MGVYEFVRYFVVLRYIDEWNRAKAVKCYYNTYDMGACAKTYGLTKDTLRGVVKRLRTEMREHRIVAVINDLIDIIENVVPILVDNYVRLKICRLCGYQGNRNVGAWIRHFGAAHASALHNHVLAVIEELRAKHRWIRL